MEQSRAGRSEGGHGTPWAWLLALLLAALLAPSAARAQHPTGEEEELPAATGGSQDDEPEDHATADDATEEDLEAPATDALEGELAGQADEAAVVTGGYEPDQRGAEEEPDTGGTGSEDGESAPAPERTVQTAGDSALELSSGGRFLGFDVELLGGLQLSAVGVLEHDNLVREDQRGGAGGTFGFAAGLRLGPVSVGPRVAFVIDPSFVLATIGLDVRAWLLPQALSPTLRASLSYALLFGEAEPLPSQRGADGVHAELGVGVGWRVDGPLTIGAELGGGYLHLERGAVEGCEARCEEGGLDLARAGRSDGLTLRVSVSVGLRF